MVLSGTCATRTSAQEIAQVISGAGITRPPGAYLRYDAGADLAPSEPGGALLGAFASWLVYSLEVGAQLAWRTEPAWLDVSLDLGIEPGWFVAVPDTERTLRWRAVARGQINLNLKLPSFWLYARTTALFRFRNFEEDDVFQRVHIREELSLEQALAPIVRVLGADPGPGLWAYVEYTIGVLAGEGVRPHRVSLGIFSERWPSEGVMVNLDLFWSFVTAEGLDGPGAILAWWIRW